MLGPAGPGMAEEAEEDRLIFVSKTTVGARLYFYDAPWDREGVTGFFDRYRYIRNKDEDAPTATFYDLLDTDLGLARSDGTYLLHLERHSFNPLNEHGRLDLDYRGIEAGVDYRRYRSNALWLFPTGTNTTLGGQPFPAYGARFTPAVTLAEVLEGEGSSYTRRQGVGGDLSLGPEVLAFSTHWVREVFGYGDYEARKGRRQDRFLLAENVREPVNSGSLRFRDNPRDLDQTVSLGGGGMVFETPGTVTAVVDGRFERFRENADPVTLATLGQSSNDFPTPAPDQAAREFRFVPDTDRINASLDLTRRFASVQVNASGSFSHLEQKGELSPLQQLYGLGPTELRYYSAHLGFDWRASRRIDINGFVKFTGRDNDLDRSRFFVAGEITRFGQESPLIRHWRTVRPELEIVARPTASSRLALGYRGELVDRDLEFNPVPTVGIQPPVSLIRPDSESHTVYVRGRTYLFRRAPVSGELGYLHAPKTSYPREFESAVYFETRGSFSASRKLTRLPVTLGWSGRVVHGHSSDFLLTGVDNSREKEFRRTLWRYDLNVTTAPRKGWTLYANFAQRGDDQELDYLRSPRPRNAPIVFDFFEDSSPNFDSNALTLTAGTRLRLAEDFDVSLASALTWSRAGFGDSSNTERVLEAVNELDNRIVSFEARTDYQLQPGVGIGVDYRLQDFVDRVDLTPLDFDQTVHTLTFRVTLELAKALAR